MDDFCGKREGKKRWRSKLVWKGRGQGVRVKEEDGVDVNQVRGVPFKRGEGMGLTTDGCEKG
jgi:hypothetical protein